MTDIDPTAAEPPSIGLCLPPTWRRTADPGCGLLVRARAAEVAAGGLRPEVVVRSEVTDLDLDPWTRSVMLDLADRLDGFAVEDDDEFDLLGHPVCYRRFAHRLRGLELLSDLWAWRIVGWGLTLTGTVAREDYWDYCDLFEMVAESVSLDELAA